MEWLLRDRSSEKVSCYTPKNAGLRAKKTSVFTGAAIVRLELCVVVS